jgi:putative polyhydroxyalkanoic acid system protein
MTQPLVVSVPHRIGKHEAIQRLKFGLESVQTKFGQVFVVQEQTWTDNRLQFRISALGQSATGTIDVEEDYARLEVTLPWLLAQVAKSIQSAVQKQGTLMLAKN